MNEVTQSILKIVEKLETSQRIDSKAIQQILTLKRKVNYSTNY